MSAANDPYCLADKVRARIAQLSICAPDSIGDMLRFRLIAWDPDRMVITMTCQTLPWMRNFAGTLHGGLCATILDQAMGFVAHCLLEGGGMAPAVQLQVSYHRPLHPSEQVIVSVHVVNVSRSLMHLTAEAFQADSPDKICLSGSGTYFRKQDIS